MAFEKINYVPGDVLTADQVNKIQDGIVKNEGNVEAHIENKNNPHKVTNEQLGAAPMTYAKKVGAPHNLLDNSDFRNPVNQRGQTSYTNTTYTIDRWSRNANIASVEIVNSGVAVTASTGNYGYFAQNVDSQLVFGKKVTFAVKTTTGLFIISGDCPETVTSEAVQAAGGIFTDFRMYVRVSADSTSLQVRVNAGTTITFEWAALYEGEYTAETLPEYQPKGYAAELLECQQYFVKYEGITLGAAVWAGSPATGATATLFTPVPMRLSNPTVTVTSFGTLRVNGNSHTPTNVTISSRSGNKLQVTVSGSFANAGNHSAALFGLTADISADL